MFLKQAINFTTTAYVILPVYKWFRHKQMILLIYKLILSVYKLIPSVYKQVCHYVMIKKYDKNNFDKFFGEKVKDK